MNKNQEALNELKELVHSELDGTRMLDKHLEYISTLQELVDKATPKKLVYEKSPTYNNVTLLMPKCPNCDTTLLNKYKHCPNCGQALDWEVEDE